MAEDGASSESSRPTNGATEGREEEDASRGSTGATTWPDEEEEGGGGAGSAGETSAQGLRQELARAQKERDDFEAQYKGLLGKLTQMRSTLGERLRQDAEELEAKDAQIESLSAETENLTSTVESLKEELVQSNAEAEKLTAELGALKQSSKSSSSDERSSREQIAALENRVRELLDSSESLRLDVESMESSLQSERAAREEAEERLRSAEAARSDAEQRAEQQRDLAEREGQTARELQSILEEFQASQDSELQRALGDYQEKYDRTALAYEEEKEKARKASRQLEEFREAAERCQGLEGEVKEKNLLIGKLRHEAVILNEHLTEALRRLRNESSDATVDRRLVTNLFLQFLTTPRADTKRFEMLSLIASVMSWNDEERETAGLQRRDAAAAASSGSRTPGSGALRRFGLGRSAESNSNNAGKGHGRTKAVDGSTTPGGEESFSNLFVEFLLSEADKAKPGDSAAGSEASAPASPSARRASGALSPALSDQQQPSFNLDALANLRRGGVPTTPDSESNGNGNAPAR